MRYLLTISSQQKTQYIKIQELRDVLSYLEDNGVVLINVNYETSGKYRQLHIHAIVNYNGLWSQLTKWGDLHYTHNTYIIHWKKINNLHGALEYITKDSDNVVKQHQILMEYKYRNEYAFPPYEYITPGSMPVHPVA